MSEPIWVTADQVVAMNEVLVQATGENHFVRDLGAIEAGCARPINEYHYGSVRDYGPLAAQLVYGIGKAHGFEQGNKRTAWAAARYFLALNGCTLRYSIDPAMSELEQLIIADVVEKLMSDDDQLMRLANAIGSHLVEIGK